MLSTATFGRCEAWPKEWRALWAMLTCEWCYRSKKARRSGRRMPQLWPVTQRGRAGSAWMSSGGVQDAELIGVRQCSCTEHGRRAVWAARRRL